MKEDLQVLAELWESGLPDSAHPTDNQWTAAWRHAGQDVAAEDEEPDEARSQFALDMASLAIGTLVADFPHSHHGDAASAAVFLLPGGTSVVLAHATYELDGPTSFVYRGRDVDHLIGHAWSLIWQGIEDREFRDRDTDPAYDPEIDIYLEGEIALRAAWANARRPEES